jgi:hypothetical protein
VVIVVVNCSSACVNFEEVIENEMSVADSVELTVVESTLAVLIVFAIVFVLVRLVVLDDEVDDE